MRKGLTEIVLVLDRSGSMAAIKQDAEVGLRAFIEGQRKAPGDARLTFYRFDFSNEKVFEDRDLNQVADYELTLHPRGSTALIDSMVQAIDEVGRRLSFRPEHERPENVVFVTITDGQENSSRSYGDADLKRRIETQRGQFKWNFIFIGCDESSIQGAINLWGYDPHLTLKNKPTGLSYHQTYMAVTSNLSNLRGGMGAESLNFTAEQRAQVNDDEPNSGISSSSGPFLSSK